MVIMRSQPTNLWTDEMRRDRVHGTVNAVNDLDYGAQPPCGTCGTVLHDHPRGFMCWTCSTVTTG